MKKVIIDTDPGIDDAIAILALLNNPNIEILGICSVGGNSKLDYTTRNANNLANYFKYEGKVYRGLDNGTFDSSDGLVHGEDGLGNIFINNEINNYSDKSAIEFILESVENNPNQIDIIALGPLTNISKCIEKNLDTMKKLNSIISMGGGIHEGNMTPVSEFNYWYDAKAVDNVYTKLGEFVDIIMVGLDATSKQILDMNDLAFFKYEGGENGQFINDLMEVYLKYYWYEEGVLGAVIHDLIAVISYLHPDIILKKVHANLRCVHEGIAQGQCIVDLVDSWKLVKNAHVVLEIDTNLYKEYSILELFGNDARNKYITWREKNEK